MKKTVYNIKGSEQLFNKWVDCIAGITSPLGLGGASIVQNDMTLSASQLNEWYQETSEKIQETEQVFQEKIEEMKRLQQETVEYIRNSN